MSARARFDRRRFLTTSLAASGAALCPAPAGAAVRALLAPGLRGTAASASRLVLLQLTGGNDGLSTVVPFGSDAYRKARRGTRIEDALPIGDGLGLHPALGGLHGAFEAGRLAVVQGVGYPRPNRSHFESMDVWHSASPERRAVGSGWIGRLSEVLAGGEHDPNRIVHVGSRLPFSVVSPTHPAASFTDAEAYRFAANEGALHEVAEEEPVGGDDALSRLRRVFRDAARSSDAIRGAVGGYRTEVDYPPRPLGAALRTAAALLKSDVGCRVVSVSQGGYDTHATQRPVHDRLMDDLDRALAAFAADLAGHEVEARTAVLAFSEFGRRVAENGSGGTDHGTAGPVLLLGAPVRGGLHGEAPSLEDLDDGDLVFTTDFRSVYASVLESLFGVEAESVLAGRHPALPLLARA